MLAAGVRGRSGAVGLGKDGKDREGGKGSKGSRESKESKDGWDSNDRLAQRRGRARTVTRGEDSTLLSRGLDRCSP